MQYDMRWKSHVASNDEAEESSQKLTLLQIRFDDMLQFSSHLIQENERLRTKNHELNNAVSVLEKGSEEDADDKMKLEGEIHHLKRQLELTKLQLYEALASNCNPFEREDGEINKDEFKAQLLRKKFHTQQCSSERVFKSTRARLTNELNSSKASLN